MAKTISQLKKATQCDRCEYADEPNKLIRYIAMKPTADKKTFEVIEEVTLCTQCRFDFLKKLLADFELGGYRDNYNRLAIEFHGLVMTKEMSKFTGWEVARPGIIQRPNLDIEEDDEV